MLIALLTACFEDPDYGASDAVRAQRDAPSLFQDMVEHYAALTVARDATIFADLSRARKELTWLARHKAVPGVTDAGIAPIVALQAEAEAGAQAKTSTDVAHAIARTAGKCGECHSGASVTVGVADAPPTPGLDLRSHMALHRWSLDRLWEGVIGPSDAAWEAGARGLAGLPEPSAPETWDPANAVVARYVHGAWEDVLDAKTLEARVQVLGDVIATCADCHASARRPR